MDKYYHKLLDRGWLKKVNYICTVLESCVTLRQLSQAYLWGRRLLRAEIQFVCPIRERSSIYKQCDLYFEQLSAKYEILWDDIQRKLINI